MKKFITIFLLSFCILAATTLKAAWHDTGPPGIKKEKFEQSKFENAPLINIEALAIQPMCLDVGECIILTQNVIKPDIYFGAISDNPVVTASRINIDDFPPPLPSTVFPHDYRPGIYNKVKDRIIQLKKPPANKLE